MKPLPPYLQKLKDADEGKVKLARATRDMLVRQHASQLIEVAVKAHELVVDEESGEGGWGPDVTKLLPLKAALRERT